MKPIAGPRFGGFSIEKPSDRIPYIQLPIAVRNLPVLQRGKIATSMIALSRLACRLIDRNRVIRELSRKLMIDSTKNCKGSLKRLWSG